jgi:hypothetical protein
VITPDINYRPAPDRAIYLQGIIDQQLVDRLTPQIILLQNQNRNPITVYIDSPGGRVDLMETLLTLLGASDQDFTEPCRLITVAISRAASAAADLLSSGDYALAYPETAVLYHGVRLSEERPLTAETTSLLAQLLRARNDNYAMELARKIEFRFMFRFIALKSKFDTVRTDNGKHLSDLECFLALISEKLSESAQQVLQKAQQRHGRYDALLDSVLRKKGKASYKSKAEFQAYMIKAVVDFEVHSNRRNKNWGFDGSGLQRLTDDFLLLNEYIVTTRSERFKRLCSQWYDFLLDQPDLEEIERAPEDEKPQKITEKVRPLLQPVWSFFVALCHALQQGENDLTARDAFWLRLIDEVIGVQELPTRRFLIEYKPDPATKANDGEKSELTAEEKPDAVGA